MSTWTLDQIRQASRLRAEMVLDAELDGAQPEAAEEMAKKLIDMAHPLGIELGLHPDNYEVVWEVDESKPWEIRGRMRWHPSTHEVELRGGHLDGQRYTLERIGEPFRVPRSTPPVWAEREPLGPAEQTSLSDVYELAGWSEDARVWIYAVRTDSTS